MGGGIAAFACYIDGMRYIDVFNGDADGICALHQLRLADPRDSELVTGVKRDIALLKRVEVDEGDQVTVLDISLDTNRHELLRLLVDGARVRYFDHHFAGPLPDSLHFEGHIDERSGVCTSLLVNDVLGGRYLPWAVAAAFGDNLFDSAQRAAVPLNLDESQLKQLEELGTCINYNGYGASEEDLYFHPAELYRRLQPFADPFRFIAEEPAFATLRDGYADDMTQAGALQPESADKQTALFILPDAAWARRVSGVYSNELAREHPERAHALLTAKPGGGYVVSVRAPVATREGADELCRSFPSGGGRKAAAGINHLPAEDLERFEEAFRAAFAR